MMDTFYLDELLDQTCEKPITMKTSKSRKATLPIFVPICIIINYSYWPNKGFLVLREWQKTALSGMTALPHPSLIFFVYFIHILYIKSSYVELVHRASMIDSLKCTTRHQSSSLKKG